MIAAARHRSAEQLLKRAVMVIVLLVLGQPPAALAGPDACVTRQAIASEIETIHEQLQRVAGRPDEAKAFAPRLKALERRLEALPTLSADECPEHLWAYVLLQRLREVREPIQRALDEAQQREAAAARKREEAARQHKIATWPEPIQRAVADRRVVIGMTSEQVLAAWGRPQKINETVTGTHRSEQWVYSDGGAYLYFTNGTLTTVQRSR
jgi:hypothetical protein